MTQVIGVQKPGVAHFRTRRVATATDIGYNIILAAHRY